VERRILNILALCMEKEKSYDLLFYYANGVVDVLNYTDKENVIYKRAYLNLEDADKELTEIEEYLKGLM
jgi:hypothetical protein